MSFRRRGLGDIERRERAGEADKCDFSYILRIYTIIKEKDFKMIREKHDTHLTRFNCL